MAVSSLCIYCGSQSGHSAIHAQQAHRLGRVLAKRNVGVIYGHGATGLMSKLADGALSANGQVTGILPKHLALMEALPNKPSLLRDELETVITNAMHERKQEMFDRSDGFIVLPGSYGTLDEFFEILTWKKIGLHEKPLVVFDINGYYTLLRKLLHHMVDEGFARPESLNLVTFVRTLDELLSIFGLAPLGPEDEV